MRTWLQPVAYKTGPAGKPRRVHLRRVDLEGRTVTAVSPRTLCNTTGIVPCPRGTRVTCRQCLRLAEQP